MFKLSKFTVVVNFWTCASQLYCGKNVANSQVQKPEKLTLSLCTVSHTFHIHWTLIYINDFTLFSMHNFPPLMWLTPSNSCLIPFPILFPYFLYLISIDIIFSFFISYLVIGPNLQLQMIKTYNNLSFLISNSIVARKTSLTRHFTSCSFTNIP